MNEIAIQFGILIASIIMNVIMIITVFVAVITYKQDKKSKKRFYWDFFIPQYLDAKFSFHDKEIDLKDGRLEIKHRYKDWKNSGYEEFAGQSKTEATYENRFAHRLSVVLNRIGQAAFVGDLPLQYIFPISAKMILEDWEKSKALIKEKSDNSDYNAINYNRKFARWIAGVSCMYLVVHHTSQSEEAEKYLRQYVDDIAILKEYKSNTNKVSEVISLLQKSDKDILALSTRCYALCLQRKFRKKMKSYVFH